MKKKIIIAVIISLLLGTVVSACSTSGNTNSNSAPPTQSATQVANSYFNAHRQASLSMCDAYFSLTNQGWSTDQIINEIKTTGALDNMPGGETLMRYLFKWCWSNDPQ